MRNLLKRKQILLIINQTEILELKRRINEIKNATVSTEEVIKKKERIFKTEDNDMKIYSQRRIKKKIIQRKET